MDVPLQLSFRGLNATDSIKDLIADKVEKLEKICDHITSCRIAVEKIQKHQQRGRPHRIRIDIKVPPQHELVIKRDSSRGDLHETLTITLNDAFDAAARKLKRLQEKRQSNKKIHPGQQQEAVVSKLFRDQGYGFLRTINDAEVYFHKNSVLHGDFEKVTIGSKVLFEQEMGEKGPQATEVRVIS
jgi:ribosomal subunit interface protein